MEPPRGERQPPTTNRSSRVLGLLAAVGFSIAMWVFIAVAVLGLILKVVGPKGAEEGLAAAGISLPQGFGLDSNATDTEPGDDLSGIAPTAPDGITTLDGRALGSADAKPPAPPAPSK